MPEKGVDHNSVKAPADVEAIRSSVERFLDTTDNQGRKIGNARCGVYVFYDYDGEPIYVGQTREKLRARIGRHLTNQRTDAVAMNVLDPFEVAEIEVWPLFDLKSGKASTAEVKAHLDAAEYTVYCRAVTESTFHAVLNEKDITPVSIIDLPASYRGCIIPGDLYEQRKHPDVRIARRAATIANLARVISERKVSKGLRRTLVTQATRLERLAKRRLAEVPGEFPIESPNEETGESSAE